MTERDEHILPSASSDPPIPAPREPREIFPVTFGERNTDFDFRPINRIDFEEELVDPKDSSALEPAEFSDSELQTQPETEPEISSKDNPAKIVSPPAEKVSTPVKV